MQTNLQNINKYAPAGHGAKHWLQQRLTALVNLIFIPTLIWCAIYNHNLETALKNPIIAAIALITTLSVAKHMMLGMQVIIEDYVHSALNKTALLAANILFVAIMAGVSIIVILKITLG